MNELKVKLTGLNDKCSISIDGTPLKFKKNKFGSIEATHKTDKTKVELSVVKYLEINSKLWWLWQIIYFFLSVFGLFDVFKDKKCLVIEAKFNINLKEQTEIMLQLNRQRNDNKALSVKTTAEFEEIKNVSGIGDAIFEKIKDNITV